MNLVKYIFILLFCTCFAGNLKAQSPNLEQYNIVWNSQSKNSGESMPTGGGDIGLNVWVENNDLLFYINRSGTFDENNTLLKQGRVRVRLNPNPFEDGEFKQELKLKEGYVVITGKNKGLEAKLNVWVDVFKPVIHVDISSNQSINSSVTYESWRYKDLFPKKRENNANSWKWATPKGEVRTNKDNINFDSESVLFYHKNIDSTVFDVAVTQQGLESVKDQLYNPIKGLVFGGMLTGKNMVPGGIISGKYMDTDFQGWVLNSKKAVKNHSVQLVLHTEQGTEVKEWRSNLLQTIQKAKDKPNNDRLKTLKWWEDFWKRSYIVINQENESKDSVAWKVGRNYQLFRYMLACNAYGKYPTKFNGGLFTYDPSSIDSAFNFTPDFRNWGGGTHTAQNQRLVYWPMLRSGDIDMMKPQFDFYADLQRNAELRSETYWGHTGASFTEQLENFGLPNLAEYNWKRPADYDKGLQYNAWLEYQWDTVLEFCMMILETERYTDADIEQYIPLIESCLTFFDEHYQYRAKNRGNKIYDERGHLILYPGSSAETYKMAYNASSTVSALQTVLQRLIELPNSYINEEKRDKWEKLLKTIPPLSYREIDGHTVISPAKLWERLNNTEAPQLYPVFPWGIYGIGRPGLDTAINTYKYDSDVLKFRSHVGWKQDNIFAARLGLTEEAVKYTTLKLNDSGRRFPAFWGPGFDWVPDHNWGGSGMIGLQEMLMQTDGEKIYILPAWPKDWDAHFKLHAPYNTTVEVVVKEGKVEKLEVIPSSRKDDVIIMN